MTAPNTKLSIIQKIEQTPAAQLPSIPEVADRFKQLYSIMHHQKAQAEMRYEAEKFHFMKLLQDKQELQQCTKLSLYGCFLDAAVNGLSFDPGAGHLYVVAFNVNVGKKDDPKWEKRATLMVSGIGELVMRQRQGQIRYADNPVLVYEGDLFKYGTRGGKHFIEHEAVLPRKTDNIIAAYVRIERPDGSSDYNVLSIEEVQKLRKFSKDPNSKAWTDGLPGMIKSKVIKHAFRTYPRIHMGNFTKLTSEVVEAPAAPAAPVFDYGLNGSLPESIDNVEAQIVSEVPQATTPAPAPADDAFMQRQPQGNTVSLDSDEF